MDTDALRWFQQVADGVTVTEVSELEGVSQPGVSRALGRLEAEVGTPLLRRSGRTLRMTHAGSAFKRHVDSLLHQLDDGLAAVSQIIEPETGTVSLAFQVSLGSWLVPDLLSRSGTNQEPSETWKARATVPVSGSMIWLTAAKPSSSWCSRESTCRLKADPAWVIRSVRPDRRSSGVPTSASSRPRARETPGWLTPSSSLTSVTVTPSATCWNQRRESVSIE